MRWLAVTLRFTARRLLALSNRLSPPVPLPASHPAARAVLARTGEEPPPRTMSREEFDRIAEQEMERWSGVLERLEPFDGPVRPRE